MPKTYFLLRIRGFFLIFNAWFITISPHKKYLRFLNVHLRTFSILFHCRALSKSSMIWLISIISDEKYAFVTTLIIARLLIAILMVVWLPLCLPWFWLASVRNCRPFEHTGAVNSIGSREQYCPAIALIASYWHPVCLSSWTVEMLL